MQPVPGGFTVPANGMLTLEPGGFHIMLMGVSAPIRAGAEVPFTLTCSGARPCSSLHRRANSPVVPRTTSRRPPRRPGCPDPCPSVPRAPCRGAAFSAVPRPPGALAFTDPAPALAQDAVASPSCHGPHQAGLEPPLPAHAAFIALDLRPDSRRGDVARLLRVWADDIARLTSGRPTLADTAPQLARPGTGLTITVGFGPGSSRPSDVPTNVPSGWPRCLTSPGTDSTRGGPGRAAGPGALRGPDRPAPRAADAADQCSGGGAGPVDPTGFPTGCGEP